ncbi:MAG: vanadium-dependent haloperoxidase [Pirellulales bacterium]
MKSLGSATGSTRTTDQTNIAKFWADGAGTITPPGHLNQMAHVVADSQGNSMAQNARLFAMLNIALADAAIMAWNTKYATEFWRPVTAIRAADTDGNANTTADTAWTPLLTTPPFPSYVSGHSSFSGTAAAVLATFLERTTSRSRSLLRTLR